MRAPGLLAGAHDVDNDFGVTYATLTPVLVGANGGAAHGTVTLDANGDGGFTYKPTSFDPAHPDDSFQYVVHAVTPEGTKDSDPVTVVIHVFGTTDHFDVFEQNTGPNGGALNQSGNVFANNNPGNFTATIASQPSHGTVALNSNGTFTYSPEAGQLQHHASRPARSLVHVHRLGQWREPVGYGRPDGEGSQRSADRGQRR